MKSKCLLENTNHKMSDVHEKGLLNIQYMHKISKRNPWNLMKIFLLLFKMCSVSLDLNEISSNFPEMTIQCYYLPILQLKILNAEMTWGKSCGYPELPKSPFASLHLKASPSFIITNEFPCPLTLLCKDWGKCYFPELLASFCCLPTFSPSFIHKLTACPHVNQMDGCTWFTGTLGWTSRLKIPVSGVLTAGQT